jgi:hypothetical protein
VRLLGDYETIGHVMWSCERYDSEKRQFLNDLRVSGTVVWSDFICGNFKM